MADSGCRDEGYIRRDGLGAYTNASWEKRQLSDIWKLDRSPPVSMIETGTFHLAIESNLVRHLVLYYVENPTARAELGTEASLRRARTKAFEWCCSRAEGRWLCVGRRRCEAAFHARGWHGSLAIEPRRSSSNIRDPRVAHVVAWAPPAQRKWSLCPRDLRNSRTVTRCRLLLRGSRRLALDVEEVGNSSLDWK